MAKLRDVLLNSNIINKKEWSFVPSSFDIVGDIAIFNDFPKELKKKEKKIAQKLIESNKNINVVVKKSKKYSGRLRTPKLTLLAGEKRKTTTHTESGCRLSLNVEKCYFSIRSNRERLRIAKKVKKNEMVLVMFSGITPFPCIISKHSKAKEIHAVELNRTANKFAKENIQKNKLTNVLLYQGDVKRVVPTIKKKFDRIILPLPKSAENYLGLALKKLKPNGTIHLYLFSNEKEFTNIKKEYKKKFKSVKLTKAGHFGPGKYRICLDLKR
jgi:tRNA (guanine37-N1)-methyltransferase